MPQSTMMDRLELYENVFTLSKEDLIRISKAFKAELTTGLKLHKENPNKNIDYSLCSLKMLDTFVPSIPTGSEIGIYYALDFGGSHLRSVRVSLKGNRNIETDYNIYKLHSNEDINNPKGLMDANTPGYMLFDRLVKQTQIIMDKYGDDKSSKTLSVGFTCSFPCYQMGLNNSKLIEWTKEFETGNNVITSPVVGQDVGKLLNESYIRNKVPGKVNAIINDTVGTLLSCAYQKDLNTPPCMIGLILGTGCNACYVEPNYKEYNYVGKIINIEFGNFNKELPMTDIDYQIDWNSSHPGHQRFEKLISGCYIGEMVRLTFIQVLREETPRKAWITDSLTSFDIACISLDDYTHLTSTFELIDKKWNVRFDLNVLQILQRISIAILKRSAALAATAIAAIADHIGIKNSQLTCGVDGSLYIKNLKYQENMKLYMNKILSNESMNIHLSAADDGSGKGAALIAAMADITN